MRPLLTIHGLVRGLFAFLLLFALAGPLLRAHRMEGEFTVAVRDANGLPLSAGVRLSSWTSSFETQGSCGPSGEITFQRIPLGAYEAQVTHPGFQPASVRVEITSELPVTRHITLDVAEIETSVTVRSTPPLIDPNETGSVLHVGRQRLDENRFSTLGRSAINVVDSLPGWLLEANAVLHPRGSEYDTQYVIDGVPLYDNRSIGFIPAFESDDFEAVHVMTANLPAEYGRRLGGVIELYTRRTQREGHHPEITAQGGSFETFDGAFSDHYRQGRNTFTAGVRGGRTDRYLDPPSLENFTNAANSAGAHARYERDFTDRDRLSLYLRSARTNFLVPNTAAQQRAGQRQDRRSAETSGQVHYQRIFSPRALGAVRGMVRDVSAELWSNPLSTPVFTQQDRGFRQGAVMGSLTYETERHTVKFGGDFRTADIREQFLFAEAAQLPEAGFDFGDSRRSTNISLFVQDTFRLRGLTIDAGLRFDDYSLLIDDSAVSPRVGLAYYWQAADLLLRASYDRVFQIPVIENLLLSSSQEAQSLSNVEGAIPVPASRADFYELGFRKALGGALRIDANYFVRDFENYYDDDVFLNTGVSFPISFDSARIEGTEVRLEMPRYKGLSAFLSYSNLLGAANAPVTGGLFVEGGEAEELRGVATQFPISQDQRNTVSALVRYQVHPRAWVSVGARYGSGLPVELEDDDDDEEEDADELDGAARSALRRAAAARGAAARALPPVRPQNDPADGAPGNESGISQAILDKVNFARGRVRPNFNLDFAAGFRIWERGQQSLTLQFDLVNATDRLNVINFTGLFSGTALAPGRMFGVKLRARF